MGIVHIKYGLIHKGFANSAIRLSSSLPFLPVSTKRCHHSLSPKARLHPSYFFWWSGKSWASSAASLVSLCPKSTRDFYCNISRHVCLQAFSLSALVSLLQMNPSSLEKLQSGFFFFFNKMSCAFIFLTSDHKSTVSSKSTSSATLLHWSGFRHVWNSELCQQESASTHNKC